jgi:methyl-accepting chemotaxis protein
MMKDLTVKQRLLLLVVLSSLLMTTLGGLAIYQMKRTTKGVETIYNDRVVPLKQLNIIDDKYTTIIAAHNKLDAGLIDTRYAFVEIGAAKETINAQWKAYTATFLVEAEKKEVAKMDALMQKGDLMIANLIKTIETGDKASINAVKADTYAVVDPIAEEVNKLINIQLEVAKSEYDASIANYKRLFNIVLVFTLLSILAGILYALRFAKSLQSSLGCEPKDAKNIANEIANGNLSNKINLEAGDDSSLLSALNTMQTSLFAKQEAANKEALRIKAALDAVTVNIRVADKEGNFVYVNPAIVNTLSRAQEDLRKRDPNFDAQNLIGKSVGVLYDDPETALSILRTQRTERQLDVKLGGRDFKLITNPIIASDGAQEGTVAQWIDKTDELRAQSEIAELVKAAAAGDLSHRINLEGKKDFFLELAQNVNQMVASTDGVINETVGALERIANGDMTHTIDTEYQGAYGVIKDNANLTIARLTDIVTQIKAVANAINVSATEISAGNIDLSQRTEEQASSLEETASSMEEMASTVKQNAENARQANLMANEASDVAIKGGQVVGEVIYTMHEINTSSKKIVDIISVIDGIAFQTNILALNAAVEAARAGEQGRGFAVVAAEVRSLAQRSAAAAKEIKQLIGDSVDKVSGGTKLVEDAGKTMDEIVTAVKMVTDIVNEIASASQEQSAGIDQVNNAITNMDEVTQQNAALVEQAAAAANSMEQQTQSLIDSVAVFKLNEIEAPNLLQVNQLHVNQPRAIASKQAFVSQRTIQKPSEKIGEKASDKNSDKANGKSNIKKSSSKTVNKDDDWEEF